MSPPTGRGVVRAERTSLPTVAGSVHATAGAGEAVIGALVARKRWLVSAGHVPAAGTLAASDGTPHCHIDAEYERPVYKFLDAPADAAELVCELRWEPRWAALLEYLRALHPRGREAIAELSADRP